MADTIVAKIPAGWYPDPLGLPQRRWWDSSSWTQHVTPDHQAAPRAQATGYAANTYAANSYTTQTHTTATGTHHDGHSAHDSAGSVGTLTQTRPTDQVVQQPAKPTVEAAPIAHAYIPMAMNTPVQFRKPDGPRASGTVAAWMIAVMPVVQLAAVLALILVLEDFGSFMQAAVAFVFFLCTAVLASHDKRRLLTLGHREAASPWWLLLTPLAYLIARSVCVRKQGGRGSAPMWVYIVLSTIPAVAAVAMFVGADALQLVVVAATR